MTDAALQTETPGRPASLPPGGSVRQGPAEARLQATGRDLGPLVWRGLFLTIVTLGIYRFWYRTDLRRWYWRNTIVDGDGLEYRGTPRELFIGFLIALAVTLPLYFAGALAALFIVSEEAGNIVTLIGLALLGVLAQYGAYRARRFRLTRTVWRGLRFDQTGSPWRYAMRSVLWGFATLLTGGLLLPLFRRALEAMKIENTRFGTADGRFSTPVTALMLRWVPIWLLLLALTVFGLLALDAAVHEDNDPLRQTRAAGMGFAGLLGAVVAFLVLWPLYRAAEFRLFTGGSALGPVSFSSDLRAASLYGMYIRFGLIAIALVLVGGGLALVVLGALFTGMQVRGANPGIGAAALLIGIYLAGVYVFMALKELMLNQPFWRRATESVMVFGLADAAGVIARHGDTESATGEGLADAIDFGGV
jgi:uncharacterized membrane protein YjgN (DUF898 family)